VRKNIVNWEPGGCVPGFCVPNSIKTCKCTHWLPRASKWPQECTSCWQRN
jgi:hypothetical protein